MRWLLLLLLCATTACGVVPDQAGRWSAAQVNPKDSIRLDKAVWLYQRNEGRYRKIEGLRRNGVPAPVLFCLHMRESDANFRCHPHEGSPLVHRTRYVPIGRLPAPAEPPFTFEQSAEDAYYVCDRLDLKDWQHLGSALQAMESFNGLGYQHAGRPPSPYLWAGTTIERPGKYTGDGHFSSSAHDAQLGCCAILKRMQQRGIAISFAP